tara:strand:+ start:639 stop:1397 length:759 start_codon:yes stop_codon:yes gene_type:complete
MTFAPQQISGQTVHARRGVIAHSFRYSVDYVLIDPDSDQTPLLFSRNGFNLASVQDRNHGGLRGHGRGVAWAREVLAERGLAAVRISQILLLTQPGFLGALFNPVSFWLVYEKAALIAVIAEVNNTFGDRHSYVCAHPGFAPISAEDHLGARKMMHVSPFQDVAGDYDFRFDIRDDRVAIFINHGNGPEGLYATLTGPRRPLTSSGLLHSALWRRPLGALRTVALIYWQAIRLKLKRAPYRTRPAPPAEEIS